MGVALEAKYVLLDRESEVGGRESEPAPPWNQEIVSVRSCVRARGVCHVIPEGTSAPWGLYLAGGRIFYLLEIFHLRDSCGCFPQGISQDNVSR